MEKFTVLALPSRGSAVHQILGRCLIFNILLSIVRD